MKKTVTVISLVAMMFTASIVPPVSADTRVEPPAACAALVTQLSDTLTKAIGSLLPVPKAEAAAGLLGDILGLLTALQNAKCLPTPPVSAPVPPPVGAPVPLPAATDLQYEGPTDCLPVVMDLFGKVFSLLGNVAGAAGGGMPDVTKLTTLLTDLIKTLTDALKKCGLPLPDAGLPTLPAVPALPVPVPVP